MGIDLNSKISYGVRVDKSIPSSQELKAQIKSLLENQGYEEEPYTNIEIQINNLTPSKEFDLYIFNSPIYIYGKYSKMSRGISQTKITRKYGRHLSSVSDFKENLMLYFQAKKIKFIGSGREDIDVRMVGGRPFILEVLEPQKNLNFKSLKIDSCKGVEIFGLKRVKKGIKPYIHEIQENKFKIYRALIYSQNMQSIEKKPINIEQLTPLRVLHRRSNLKRKRTVEINCFDIFGKYAIIELKAEAGCYIKEFINGDFGRTVPSITSILESFCDCLELDVLNVENPHIPEDLVIHNIERI